MAVPTTPCSTDSARIRRMMVPRVAPTARSMPMSCRRSTTTARKVLKIRKPAMNSVSTPKKLNDDQRELQAGERIARQRRAADLERRPEFRLQGLLQAIAVGAGGDGHVNRVDAPRVA